MTAPDLVKGDYVLATKYSDADPGDHWAVGFYYSTLPKLGGDRYLVVDNDGKQFRRNGFRHCQKITDAQGQWLIDHMHEIDATIPDVGYDDDGNWYGRNIFDWLALCPTETNNDD